VRAWDTHQPATTPPRFPNCLVYKNSEEFTACLETAMRTDPRPLSPDQLQALTWEAATHRFLDVAELKDPPPLHEQLFDSFLAAAHNTLTGVEPLRIAAGAGANTRDAPSRLTDYTPSEADIGGLFDDSTRAKRIYGKQPGPGEAAAAAGPAAGGAAGAEAEAMAAAEEAAPRSSLASPERQQARRSKGHRRRVSFEGDVGNESGKGAAEVDASGASAPQLNQQQQQQQQQREREGADNAPSSGGGEEAPQQQQQQRRRGWRRWRPVAAEAP